MPYWPSMLNSAVTGAISGSDAVGHLQCDGCLEIDFQRQHGVVADLQEVRLALGRGKGLGIADKGRKYTGMRRAVMRFQIVDRGLQRLLQIVELVGVIVVLDGRDGGGHGIYKTVTGVIQHRLGRRDPRPNRIDLVARSDEGRLVGRCQQQVDDIRKGVHIRMVCLRMSAKGRNRLAKGVDPGGEIAGIGAGVENGLKRDHDVMDQPVDSCRPRRCRLFPPAARRSSPYAPWSRRRRQGSTAPEW